ncbi:hypothetical protein DICPUDRAFT_11690, partial [Dictyostelium purpureum]
TDVGHFLLGLAEGLEMAVSSEAQQCFNDATTSFKDFENAFSLISQGFKTYSKDKIESGFIDLGAGLLLIPDIYEQCNIQKFVNEIRAIAEKLESGEAGVFEVIIKEVINIFAHHTAITTEFKMAISDWQNNDFLDSGINVGKILGILLQ